MPAHRVRNGEELATEVSSDNSALMRNIRKNENAMQGAICGVSRALLACARTLGHKIHDEGDVGVLFDDSIVQDTTAEKKQDMAEVAAGLMETWEYRAKWYGESEGKAKGVSQSSSHLLHSEEALSQR